MQKYHMFGWIIEIIKRTCKRQHLVSGSHLFFCWVNLWLFCVFIAERLHCLFIAGNIHRAVKIRTPRNTYLGNMLRRAWATKINSVWTFWRAYALANCFGLFLARNFGHCQVDKGALLNFHVCCSMTNFQKPSCLSNFTGENQKWPIFH